MYRSSSTTLNAVRMRLFRHVYARKLGETASKEKSLAGPSTSTVESVAEPLPLESRSVAKGLFCNKVDLNLLSYPEYADTEELLETEDYVLSLERYFKTKVDSRQIDSDRALDDELIHNLKTRGVFGLRIAKEFGGRELDHKTYARVFEVLSRDWSIFSTVLAHNSLCAEAIMQHGTREQQAAFLPRLASGESLGSFALHEESSGSDMAAMRTQSDESALDHSPVTFSGVKNWVTNGGRSDIFVSFAKAPNFIYEDTREVPSTAFIIDKRVTDRVKVEKRQLTPGLRGADISDVRFDRVLLPQNSVLGQDEMGFHVAVTTLRANNYVWGTAAASYVKRMIDQLTEYCNATTRFDRRLSDSVIVQKSMQEIAVGAYAAESMSYYVAGLLDEMPEMDFEMEGACIKVFSRELLRRAVYLGMQTTGAQSFNEDLDFEMKFRDIITLSSFMGSDEYLKSFIAMSALTAWAAETNVDIDNVKHPFRMTLRSGESLAADLMRLPIARFRHYINEHVHPSLEVACRYMEEAMTKFDYIFQRLVTVYGKDIENEFLVLERLSTVATLLFASFAVISRASRSYCIGLRNGDREVQYAELFCVDARFKIIHALQDITDDAQFMIMDERRKGIAVAICKEKGWLIESPMQRNW